MTGDAPNIYVTRVRVHQTDLNGTMYHGAYLDIFDDARIETFRRLGYTYARMISNAWGAIIRRVDCEYFVPAMMDDLLSVTVRVPALTRATMTFRYECRREEETLALGHAVFAFLSDRGRAIRVPPDLRQVVEDHADLLLIPT